MTYPLMIDGATPVAISAHPAISAKLTELDEKANQKGIQALNQVEWCLRIILREADMGLKAGAPEVNLGELGHYTVESLKDEGVELWQGAFNEASEQAIALFSIHPDSQ